MLEKQKFALKMNNISMRFPGTLAVDKMDFDVKYGEVHALVGENGAGKSTLMKILSGAYDNYTGDINIGEKSVNIFSPFIARQQGIAMVYQELSLALPISVAENILAGNLPKKGIFVDKKKSVEKAHALLSRVGLENMNPLTEVNQLSQHEMQLVEIAKALGRDPKILVLDEPTSALTQEEVDLLFIIINKLKESGLAIIYISHHLSEMFEIADRVTVMRDGCKVCTVKVKETTSEKIVEYMVGRSLSEFYMERNESEGEEFLRVEKLSRYGFFHDISFSVRSGEVVGICGLAGAGRSEIARSIVGLDPVDEGSIYVKNTKVHINSLKQAIKKGIGYLPENRKIDGIALRLSVEDNITSAILPELSKHFIYNAKIGKPKVKDAMDKLSIVPPNPAIEVSNLSGGNQQKVLLAKWLSTDPILLILDEPTRGVDVGAKQIIHDAVTELTKKGLAVVLISSDLPELVRMSHRLIILKEGHLIGELKSDSSDEESALLAANGVFR